MPSGKENPLNNAVSKESGLQIVQPGAVVSADEWNDRRVAFIKSNYCNNAPDPEADAFITICKRRGLAPEEKQIYLIPRAGKWTVQTSIDGYRLIAERSGLYAGSDDPVYEESEDKLPNGKRHPNKATVTVWKVVNGVRCPFTSSAYWDEYNSGQNLWLTHPYVMLAKCAESQALRKAFPADLSGIYTVEEMDQASSPPQSNRATARVNQGANQSPEIPDHTAFYKRLRAAKKTKDDFVDIVKQDPTDFPTWQDAWDALVEAEKEAGSAPASAEPTEAQYREVEGVQVDQDGAIVDPSPAEKPLKKPVAEFGKPEAAAPVDRHTR